MVESAAIKQGRSANRKHTFSFFGLSRLRKYLIDPKAYLGCWDNPSE